MGTAAEPEEADLGVLYRAARERISQLLTEVDRPDQEVAACPGWSVHDVLAHLVCNIEDANAGLLSGPPSDEFTAGQVARRRDQSVPEMLAEWSEVSPAFEDVINTFRVWPAYIDVLTHEHDMRGALGLPAGHDSPEIVLTAQRLVSWLRPPVALVVRVGSSSMDLGPQPDSAADAAAVELVTTPFEAFRFRMGRRSRAQMEQLSWIGDPAAVLDGLPIFGPSPVDIIE